MNDIIKRKELYRLLRSACENENDMQIERKRAANYYQLIIKLFEKEKGFYEV